MLRVIDRYLLKEVIQNWVAVTLVLWVIIVSNRMARFLGEAASGELPGNVIFILLGLKSVEYLVTLLPLTLYLGVLLALGRLYKDSEMAALGACGVGPGGLYRPLLGLATLVAVAIGGLALFVSPRAAELGYEIRADAEGSTDLSVIAPGRFQETSNGRIVFYAERIAPGGNELQTLFVRTVQEGVATLLTARAAHQKFDPATGDRFLVMEDGYRYQGFPGDATFRVVKFARHSIRLEAAEMRKGYSKHDAIASEKLWGSTKRHDVAELQWRLSLPLATIGLVLLAVPLSRTTPRQGRFGKLFAAVLIFIVYYNLLGTAQVWVEKGAIGTLPGIWWVHLLPVGLALLLFHLGRMPAPRNHP